MILSCNPGSWLEVVGSFELEERLKAIPEHNVIDPESGQIVTLYDLLRSFSYDPDEARTGRIKITITHAATRL